MISRLQNEIIEFSSSEMRSLLLLERENVLNFTARMVKTKFHLLMLQSNLTHSFRKECIFQTQSFVQSSLVDFSSLCARDILETFVHVAI